MKNVLKRYLSLIMITAFCSCLWADIFIKLHPCCETSESLISLGMIADISSEELTLRETEEIKSIVISQTPKFGITSYVSKFDVLRALRRKEIYSSDVEFAGSYKSRVKRPEIILSREELKQIISSYLAANSFYTPRNEDIMFLTHIRDISLPEGYEISVSYEPSSRYAGGTIKAEFFYQESSFELLNIKIKILSMVTCIKANTNIIKGTLITEEMLIEDHSVRESRFYNQAASLENIIGKIASKNINKGSVIKNNHLKDNIIVKRGSIVKLTANVKSMKIELNVKALKNAAKGDLLPVKNLESGKEFNAVAVDSANVILKGAY